MEHKRFLGLCFMLTIRILIDRLAVPEAFFVAGRSPVSWDRPSRIRVDTDFLGMLLEGSSFSDQMMTFAVKWSGINRLSEVIPITEMVLLQSYLGGASKFSNPNHTFKCNSYRSMCTSNF